MPEIKADRDQVINTYFECKRRREAQGKSMYGINTEVAKVHGVSRQRVGQIIQEYEAELDAGLPVMSSQPKANRKDRKQTESIPAGKKKWEEAAPKAREKWTRSLGHQEQEGHSGQKSPQRTGETSPSGLNDDQSIKQVQDVIKELRFRNEALEARLARLEEKLANRDPVRGNQHRGTPRQDQVLEILQAAPTMLYTYVGLAHKIGCSESAIRNASHNLVKNGKVVIVKKGRLAFVGLST